MFPRYYTYNSDDMSKVHYILLSVVVVLILSIRLVVMPVVVLLVVASGPWTIKWQCHNNHPSPWGVLNIVAVPSTLDNIGM